MTGKSELTGSLRSRLAEVLQSTALEPSLSPTARPTSPSVAQPTASIGSDDTRSHQTRSHDMTAYVAQPEAIRRTLATLPQGDGGRALKRRLLDAIEDHALDARIALDGAFFELRRQVLAGEL
jgi:hypothetical protein